MVFATGKDSRTLLQRLQAVRKRWPLIGLERLQHERGVDSCDPVRRVAEQRIREDFIIQEGRSGDAGDIVVFPRHDLQFLDGGLCAQQSLEVTTGGSRWIPERDLREGNEFDAECGRINLDRVSRDDTGPFETPHPVEARPRRKPHPFRKRLVRHSAVLA